jgi:hypothetical protein
VIRFCALFHRDAIRIRFVGPLRFLYCDRCEQMR